MKHVILSADGSSKVYSVPDAVADDLEHYCLDFSNWLYESPDAAKYHDGVGVCYDETDFIAYLNTWVFPEQTCSNASKIRWVSAINLPTPDHPGWS